MELARDWREHLRAQYHDRLIYWSLRWASRSSLDVLTIIIDSMDQVKTAWPQYKFARKPHSLESLKRPRVILTAVLCHGWCSNVFIADEALHHGAASFCDMISRSLDNGRDCREERPDIPAAPCDPGRQHHSPEQKLVGVIVPGLLGVGRQVFDVHIQLFDSGPHT